MWTEEEKLLFTKLCQLAASLQRVKISSTNKCFRYDIKPTDGEVPVLYLWGMWSTSSLWLLPGPLASGVVGFLRIPSMGQIKLFNLLLGIIIIIIDRLIVLVGRMFTNGPGDLGSIPGRVIPKTFKMVLDTSLLNTQQYKVHIKGKVEKSRERSSGLPYTLV